jgi:predicted RNA binding protein YcfA (HicA-like mRNA interferase family)
MRIYLRIAVDSERLMCKYMHTMVAMRHETNTAKIVARLTREGWENLGGAKHAKFRKPDKSAMMVPRHRTVTPGVAKSIARAAGWE